MPPLPPCQVGCWSRQGPGTFIWTHRVPGADPPGVGVWEGACRGGGGVSWCYVSSKRAKGPAGGMMGTYPGSSLTVDAMTSKFSMVRARVPLVHCTHR